MATDVVAVAGGGAPAAAAPDTGGYRRRWHYLLFAFPALFVIFAVIWAAFGF